MMHLDDGTLQAFLDDELPPEERAPVAEHLLACQRCNDGAEELTRANALFSRSISVLDVAPPATRPAGGTLRRRARVGTSSFVKAAGLVLAVAAAASAAVPGSPVREWVAQVVAPMERETGAVEAPPAPVAAAPAPAPVPAGVSISPAAGRMLVSLSGLRETVIRLGPAAGPQASISVLGAERDPVFQTSAGRVQVRDGLGGEVRVWLPLAVEGARLEVDGELYAEVRGGSLQLHVPGETVDGEISWP